jgi:hypothetical protein
MIIIILRSDAKAFSVPRKLAMQKVLRAGAGSITAERK